jgi:hypothetical protein
MRNRRLLLAVILVAAAQLGATAPLFAASANSAQINVTPNFSGGTGPFSANVTQPGVIDLTGSATGGSNSSGSAICDVHYGSTRGSGSAHGSLNSGFRGIFRDTLIITSPGVATGSVGTLTFHIRVDGSVAATNGFSAASWSLQADLGGGSFDMNHGGHSNAPEVAPSGYSGDAIGTYGATISFLYGMPTTLDVELSVNAAAGNGSSGAGAAAFDFGAYWAGIDGVKAGAVTVGNFTVTSASGVSYAATPVAVTVDPSGATRLENIAPNPAFARAAIAFDLARAGAVTLEIVDVNGRRVKRLREGELAAGRYSLDWARDDDAGHAVAPGVYFVRLSAPDAVQATKVVVAH